MIRFKKLNEDAIIPTRAHPGDAGLDLYTVHDIVLPPYTALGAPGVAVDIAHGVAAQLPYDTWGLLIGRSSTARSGLQVSLGVIDHGYRGELFSFVTNHNRFPYEIPAGSRISQLLVLPAMGHEKIMVVDELDFSYRGEKGFGSTGQ